MPCPFIHEVCHLECENLGPCLWGHIEYFNMHRLSLAFQEFAGGVDWVVSELPFIPAHDVPVVVYRLRSEWKIDLRRILPLALLADDMSPNLEGRIRLTSKLRIEAIHLSRRVSPSILLDILLPLVRKVYVHVWQVLEGVLA